MLALLAADGRNPEDGRTCRRRRRGTRVGERGNRPKADLQSPYDWELVNNCLFRRVVQGNVV